MKASNIVVGAVLANKDTSIIIVEVEPVVVKWVDNNTGTKFECALQTLAALERALNYFDVSEFKRFLSHHDSWTVRRMVEDQHYSTATPSWEVVGRVVELYRKKGIGMDWEQFIEEHVRIDSKTGQVITEGYVINDGDRYFENRADAIEYLITEEFYTGTDNDIAEEAFSDGTMYWTEW